MVQPGEIAQQRVSDLQDLKNEGELLRAEVVAERAQYKRTSLKVIIALIVGGVVSLSTLALAIVLVVVLAGIENRQDDIQQAQVESKERGQAIKDLLSEIRSCTNTDGACAQRNAANTKAIITLLVEENRKSNEEIVRCARRSATEVELDACFAAARAKEGAQ